MGKTYTIAAAILVVLTAFFLAASFLFSDTLQNEKITTAKLDKKTTSQIGTLYYIDTSEAKLRSWKKYEYGDNDTFYVLTISVDDAEEYIKSTPIFNDMEKNNTTDIAMIKHRSTYYPCVYYSGSTVKIVTTDIRDREADEEHSFLKGYSDSIADNFGKEAPKQATSDV